MLQATTARDSVPPEKRRPLMEAREVGEAAGYTVNDGEIIREEFFY